MNRGRDAPAGGRAGTRRRPWLRDWTLWILLALGLVAIVLAWIGWATVLNSDGDPETGWPEALYRALSVNMLSELYAQPFGGGDALTGQTNAWLQGARWVGAVVFFLTIAQVLLSVFWTTALTVYARCRCKNHVVIAGERAFARRAGVQAAEGGLRAVHFRPGGRERTDDGILTLDSDIGLERMLQRSGAIWARCILFAFEDNAYSAELADRARTALARENESNALHKRLVRWIRGRPGEPPHIFTFLDDGWFEHRDELRFRFHTSERSDGRAGQARKGQAQPRAVVEVISESRCAAKAAFSRFPVYARHEDRDQHILLQGFGAMGEALLAEFCETQRTDPDRLQKVTILDFDPTTWRNFTRRCPEWDKVFDGQFFAARPETLEGDDEAAFLKRLKDTPMSAAYVATGDGLDPTLAAARLKEVLIDYCEDARLPAAALDAPIFVCVRGGTAVDGLMGDAKREGRPEETRERLPIVQSGAWHELVVASRVLERQPDLAARRVDAIFSRSDETATPPARWAKIAEVNRYSSRSAAAYIPTLMHVAGFDLAPWRDARWGEPARDIPSGPEPVEAALATLPALAQDCCFPAPKHEVQLARLEHARWCAERRLRGYRHGETTDHARRRHADLVAFDDLPEENRAYNINYVRLVGAVLIPKSARYKVDKRHRARKLRFRPGDLAIAEIADARADTEAGDTQGEPDHA